MDEALSQLRAVETDLQALLTLERLRARVERLRCFRGIDGADDRGRARRPPGDSRPRRGPWRLWGWCPPSTPVGPSGRGRDHEDGQRPSAPRARRSRVALSASSVCGGRVTAPPTGPPPRSGAGVGGPAPPASPVSSLGRARQSEAAPRDGGFPRTDQFRVGGVHPVIRSAD